MSDDADRTYSLDDLLHQPTRWDDLIAADLSAEIERLLAEKINTIPEMRRFLAIKGYRELRRYLEAAIQGRSGEDALRAMVFAMRTFARDRPGLSAATFKNLAAESPEWRREGEALTRLVLGVFADLGVTGRTAGHALRALRALVRGFVIHEMTCASLQPSDHDDAWHFAVDLYMRGLIALRTTPG